MRKWITGAALAAVLVAVVAWAGPGGREGMRQGTPRGGGCPMWSDEAAEKAELSAEDTAALDNLRYEHQKKTIPLRAECDLARLEVRRLMDQDDADKDAVLAAVENAGKAQTALRKAQVELELQVRALLGPEKAARLREARRECRHERGDGMRKGPGDGHRRWGPPPAEMEGPGPEDMEESGD